MLPIEKDGKFHGVLMFNFFMKTLLRDVTFVASLTDIALFLTFLTVNLALIWLRYKFPKRKRPFKSPINIGNFSVLAALGVASSFLMLMHFTKDILILGAGIVVAGLAIGELCIKWPKR